MDTIIANGTISHNNDTNQMVYTVNANNRYQTRFTMYYLGSGNDHSFIHLLYHCFRNKYHHVDDCYHFWMNNLITANIYLAWKKIANSIHLFITLINRYTA